MKSDNPNQAESPSQKSSQGGVSNTLRLINEWPHNQGHYSPWRFLIIITGGIVLAEIISMILVYSIRNQPYIIQIIVDIAVLTALIFLGLYFIALKPLIQQQSRSESILQARLRLMQYANTHALDEILQFSLDEIETLTGSTIGFLHFFEADQNTLWLQSWSTNTLQNMCKAEGKDSHYAVEEAGVWADAVRYRKPIIHNAYANLPNRKGMPEGHAPVVREMIIPILRNERVVATLGLGNKPQDFNDIDVEVVSTYADFAWDVIEHKRSDMAILQSEEKFRTLAEWTYDWEKWLDPQGNIIYTSPSCERMTGYRPEELIEDPHLLIRMVHPDDRQDYEEHHRMVHDPTAGPSTIEYRIISRDGSERWIEHVCRPLYGTDDGYLGRRVSSRDISKRKQAEMKIIEQNRREAMLTQLIRSIQGDIARDLHDTLGQNIGYLRMNLEFLQEDPWSARPEIKTQIQNMTKAASESNQLIRAMLTILQTEDSTDPLGLFRRFAEQVAQRSSFQSEISSQGHPRPLSPHHIRQLFYIFREALSNVEKYAQASHVAGVFRWDEEGMSLTISDDGRGFDQQAVQVEDHFGLKFMRERAESLGGSFLIHSAQGKGTRIIVMVPYEDDYTDLYDTKDREGPVRLSPGIERINN